MPRVVEVTGNICIDGWARAWCLIPYPGHSKGCPNFNRRETCPLKAPLVGEYFDLSRKMWFVIASFNLNKHAMRMKERHPGWSDRQARCCLYWQGSVRKRLNQAVAEALAQDPGLVVTNCPEAMGVDVFTTMEAVGQPIERDPVCYVRKVAMVGYPRSVT